MRLRLAIGALVVATVAQAQGAPAARPLRPDTVRMHLVWEVAEGLHPTADSLGELSGIAMDAAGNVYVSDFSAMKVWVFDAAGRSQRGIGRKGKGPGEFEAPTGPAIGPDGRLYVRDASRVSRFVADPATRRLTQYDSAFLGPTMNDWRSKRATRFDADGRIYYPHFAFVARTPTGGSYVRFSKSGQELETVAVPRYPTTPTTTAFYRLDATGGRMLDGLNHVPFAPIPVWDITPRGTVLSGPGDVYLLRETDDAAQEIRRFGREVPVVAIPPTVRAESTAALRRRLDSIPVPLDRVEGMPPDVRSLRLPQALPAMMAVHTGNDGLVWVRRWTMRPDTESAFDVFDAKGLLVAVVRLPRAVSADPPPALTLDGIAAIGVDAETGANTVLYFRRER